MGAYCPRISVTKWIEHLLNSWPLATMNICAIVAKYFAKVGPKFCQILNKPQKGDIDEVL